MDGGAICEAMQTKEHMTYKWMAILQAGRKHSFPFFNKHFMRVCGLENPLPPQKKNKQTNKQTKKKQPTRRPTDRPTDQPTNRCEANFRVLIFWFFRPLGIIFGAVILI